MLIQGEDEGSMRDQVRLSICVLHGSRGLSGARYATRLSASQSSPARSYGRYKLSLLEVFLFSKCL